LIYEVRVNICMGLLSDSTIRGFIKNLKFGVSTMLATCVTRVFIMIRDVALIFNRDTIF